MKHERFSGQTSVRIRARLWPVEWRTVSLILGCYALWAIAGLLYVEAVWVSIPLLASTVVLHSSLQHEAIHRHPTRNPVWNEALVFWPLGLLVPFRRYRALHLLHHADSRLTDPYDDPESFYLAAYDHRRLPSALRTLLAWNNRLVVRMLVGPAISAIRFLLSEIRLPAPRDNGDRPSKRQAWGLHAIGLIAVVAFVHFGFRMPIYAYLGSVYLGLSLLALRSFCEHRWAEATSGRTVIVERSLLGLLFLNNNLHLVHHTHPGLPWYALPHAYRTRAAAWQTINDGYVFRNYREVMRDYGLRPKEPVIHPTRIER